LVAFEIISIEFMSFNRVEQDLRQPQVSYVTGAAFEELVPRASQKVAQ